MFFAFDASRYLLFSFPLLASAQLCPWWVEVPLPLCRNALACSPERKKETAVQLTMCDCVAEQVFTVREGRIQEMGEGILQGWTWVEGTGGGGMWWGLINSAGLKNGVVCGVGGCFEVGMEGILTPQTWVTSSSQPLLAPQQTLACCPVARTCRPAPRNCPSSGGSWCLCVAQGGSRSNDGGRGRG